MRVLLAFDKFKDSLTADAACDVTAAALRSRHPEWMIDACPLADGGEGFAAILTRAAGGQMHVRRVIGPRGAPVDAAYGLVPVARVPQAALKMLGAVLSPGDTIAVIEMAAASGLALLSNDERDVWQTTTVGTGELLRAAAQAGAHAIVLGVGGSATSDLGLGALVGLGLECHASAGERIATPAPATWRQITHLGGKVALPPVYIACDVSNPLLGPNGAAAVYGPQKGLRADRVSELDDAAARVGRMLCTHCDRPESLMDTAGAGAAGGIAFGLMVAADAHLLPGFDFVSRWLDVEARIAAADLVLTGEGRFDDSSLSGKGPGAVAARALEMGKRVTVFAGAVTVRQPPPGLSAHAITPPGTPLPQALREAGKNLGQAVREQL